jgi:hypothetical protein
MGAPQYEQAGADIGGTGTTNTIPRWTGPSTLGDSGLIDNGTVIGVANGTRTLAFNLLQISGNTLTTSTAELALQYATSRDTTVYAPGSSIALIVKGTTGNVGIGTASPGAQLHVERAGGSSTNAEYLRLRNTTIATGSNASQSFFVNGNTVATGNISHAWNGTTYDTIFNVWNGSALAEAGRAIGGSTPVLSVPSGLKLPATPGNADTQTLDCYLDGGASGGATWAPVDNSGAGLTFTVTSARYMRIGRLVLASFDITFPATASGAQAKVSLPVTSQAVWQGASIGFGPNVPGLAAAVNNADVAFWTYGAATTNAALSGARLIVSMSYFAN